MSVTAWSNAVEGRLKPRFGCKYAFAHRVNAIEKGKSPLSDSDACLTLSVNVVCDSMHPVECQYLAAMHLPSILYHSCQRHSGLTIRCFFRLLVIISSVRINKPRIMIQSQYKEMNSKPLVDLGQ